MSLISKKRTLSFEDLGSTKVPRGDEASPIHHRPRSNTFDVSPPKSSASNAYNPKRAVSTVLQSLRRNNDSTPELDAAAIAEKFLSVNPPMPLRMRAGSEAAPFKGLVSLRSKADAKPDNDVETLDRWRDRIWPQKAIYSFCRAITRCQPPKGLVPGAKLGLRDKHTQGSGCCLSPHWSPDALQKIPLTFDSTAAHAGAFFLHLIEESRESSTAQDGGDAGYVDAGGHGWCVGEVLSVLAETERGKLPHKGDPRMGSIWVLRLRLSAFEAARSGVGGELAAAAASGEQDSAVPSSSSPSFSSSSAPPAAPTPAIPEIAGGDLLLLQNPRWEHPLLAVAQGWDPDYDLKFGSLRSESCGDSRDMLNLLVCVDHGTAEGSGAPGSKDGDVGGWVQQGVITVGLKVHMVALGNVLTSMREAQALASLRVLNRPLQQVIISACGAASVSGGAAGAGGHSPAPPPSAGPAAPAAAAPALDDSAGPIRGSRKSPGQPHYRGPSVHTEPSPFSPPPPPPKLACPESLPPPLWDTHKVNDLYTHTHRCLYTFEF